MDIIMEINENWNKHFRKYERQRYKYIKLRNKIIDNPCLYFKLKYSKNLKYLLKKIDNKIDEINEIILVMNCH